MAEQNYTLYGGEISYFTGKIRAYLRWKQIPFQEVLADADVYRSVIVPRVGFPVIPVIVTPQDETLQDTSAMIDELERRFPQPPVHAATPVQRLVGHLLELYGDEWLVIPAMHYRWHYNRDWAIRQFGALSAPQASPEQQAEIGAKLAGPFANAARLLGGEPHIHAAIERSYEALLGELDRHFAQYPYVLGDRPSLADFGLYGPLYAHQYRDPVSGELMRRLAPNVARWVERLRDDLPPAGADLLPNDQIPDTLLPVLARMFREQLPVLTDSAQRLRQWLAEHPGEPVPRVIGKHAFELEGERGERIMRAYSLWMLQRARDCYLALDGADRAAADALLESVGGELFQRFDDPPRLARAGMSVRVVGE